MGSFQHSNLRFCLTGDYFMFHFVYKFYKLYCIAAVPLVFSPYNADLYRYGRVYRYGGQAAVVFDHVSDEKGAYSALTHEIFHSDYLIGI